MNKRKNLINRIASKIVSPIKNTLGNISRPAKNVAVLSTIVAALGVASACNLVPTPEPDPNPRLSASPDYGEAQFDSRVTFECDGDIDKYRVVNENTGETLVVQSNTIDKVLTFDDDATLEGYCTRPDGTTFVSVPKEIDVTPSIPTPENNLPKITSTPVTEAAEGEPYNYKVQATDSDEDDLTFSLTSGPPWLSVDPSTGAITGTAPFSSSSTESDVEVEVTDGKDSVTQSYKLNAKFFPIVSGRVEGNKNGTRQGPVGLFEHLGGGKYRVLAETVSDAASGEFTIQSTLPVNNYEIRAMTGSPDNPQSYVRRLRNQSKDLSGLLIEPSTYVDVDGSGSISTEEIDKYAKHMKEVNFTYFSLPEGKYFWGLRKWNFGEFPGEEEFQEMRLFEENENGRDGGYLSPKAMQEIKDMLLVPTHRNYSGCFIENEETNRIIANDISLVNGGYTSELAGRIDIEPDFDPRDSMTGNPVGGYIERASDYDWDGYNDYVKIVIRVNPEGGLSGAQNIPTHEKGHALTFPGHSMTYNSSQTIMSPNVNLSKPSDLDCSAAEDVYTVTWPAKTQYEDVYTKDLYEGITS